MVARRECTPARWANDDPLADAANPRARLVRAGESPRSGERSREECAAPGAGADTRGNIAGRREAGVYWDGTNNCSNFLAASGCKYPLWRSGRSGEKDVKCRFYFWGGSPIQTISDQPKMKSSHTSNDRRQGVRTADCLGSKKKSSGLVVWGAPRSVLDLRTGMAPAAAAM